jgi:hypothetical protein
MLCNYVYSRVLILIGFDHVHRECMMILYCNRHSQVLFLTTTLLCSTELCHLWRPAAIYYSETYSSYRRQIALRDPVAVKEQKMFRLARIRAAEAILQVLTHPCL